MARHKRKRRQRSPGSLYQVLEQRAAAKVQSLLLSKDRFRTVRAARAWIVEQNEEGASFRHDKVDIGGAAAKFFRFKQFDTSLCTSEPRTIMLTQGVKAVICRTERAGEGTLMISRETPGQLMRRLPHIGREELTRDADILRYHLVRMRRRGLEHVGRGWTPDAIIETLKAVQERLGEAVHEVDFEMEERRPSDRVSPRREGGIHAHRLAEDGSAGIGGRHPHAFLWRGSILFTEFDGAHTHDTGEEKRTAAENGHEHQAVVPTADGGAITVTFAATTPHDHEKLVGTTALDGLHEHSTEIEGAFVKTLTPEEFRNLFGTVEEVIFPPELAESLGASRVETGKVPLPRWWGEAAACEAVRSFLAPYALGVAVQETVEQREAGAKWAIVEELAIPLGHEALSMTKIDGEQFIIIDTSEGGPNVVLRRLKTPKEAARVSAIASVNKEREHVMLARLVGAATEGAAQDKQVYREVASYHFMPDERILEERAAEAMLDALRRLTEPGAGSFTGRVAEADDDYRWNIVPIQAGLSKNRNFWPASLLREKLVNVLNEAPLEAIEAGPTKMSHMRVETLMALEGKGAVLSGVGQVKETVFQQKGGTVPDPDEVRAIARFLNVTEAEVRRESKGQVAGVGYLDHDDKGRTIADKLRSAEERGSLEHYLGLSIDVERAPGVPIQVPGKPPIMVRTDVDGAGRVVVDFVSHPAAGGKVEGRAA